MREQEYFSKAAGCLLAAKTSTDAKVRDEFYALALINLRLAELAKQNSQTDLAYEAPPRPHQGLARDREAGDDG